MNKRTKQNGRFVYCSIMLSALCLLVGTTLFSQPANREFSIKAAFLFNFTRFVDWPTTAFEAPNAPFVIGILGNDPFGPVIDATVSGEKYETHPIVIERYSSIKDIRPCHILFITNQELPALSEIVQLPALKNCLTVGETPAFVSSGGILRFKNENNKVKLQINPVAAKAAELTISSQLLRLAEITTTL